MKTKQAGFTLIEMLIALAILALVGAGFARSSVFQMRQNVSTSQKTGAVAAAQEILEARRSEDPSLFPTSGSAGPDDVVIGDRTYQVWTSYCNQSTYCSSNTRHLAVSVSLNGKVLHEVETVYTKLR